MFTFVWFGLVWVDFGWDSGFWVGLRAWDVPTEKCSPGVKSSQVKFLLSTQIKNSPPLVPGAGGLRRRQDLNHPGAR